MQRLRKWLDWRLENPGHAVPKVALVTVLVVLVTYMRWAVDRGAGGFTFSQYFPVITGVAIVLGWRYAAWAGVLSLVLVRQVFLNAIWFEQSWSTRLLIIGFYVLTVTVICVTTNTLRELVREKEDLARQVRDNNSELHHRSANLVQVLVNWIEVGLTRPDQAEYFASLSDKLVAWTRSNGMLGKSLVDEFDLRELIEHALRPFDLSRFALEGADATIDPRAARTIVLVLHELATNSTKYGSLGGASGAVRLAWQVQAARATFQWRETGSPLREPGGGSSSGLQFVRSLDALGEFDVTQEDDDVRVTKFSVELG